MKWQESFEALDSWLFEVEKNATPGVMKMVIANKSDLDTKEVSKEMGEEYAKKNGLLFMETSAKKDYQVSLSFQKLSERLIDLKFSLPSFS